MRGLRDIRTHAGNAEKTPHRLYMQITCLEMERARRSKERASASRRVEDIDARFKEIDAEKRRLLEAIGEHTGATQGRGDSAGGRGRVSRQGNGGRTFRY